MSEPPSKSKIVSAHVSADAGGKQGERPTKVKAVQSDIAKGSEVGSGSAGAEDIPEDVGGLLRFGIAAQDQVGIGAAQTDHDLLAYALALRDAGCQSRAADACKVGRRIRRCSAVGNVKCGLNIGPIELSDEAHDDHVNVAVIAQVHQGRIRVVLRLAIVDGEHIVAQRIK